MQFLAFLKDSFREARSGWVLQAMLVLSALLVLFVFSVSFKPTTVEADLNQGFRIFNWALRQNPDFAGTKFTIENYSESNSKEPWKSDYQFDFVITAPTPEAMKKLVTDKQLPTSSARVSNFIGQAADYLDNVKVEKLEELPDARKYRVTTSGTNCPDITAWKHVPTVLFAFDMPWFATSLRGGVFAMENYLISGVGAWIVLFISVVISAAFIPNMLQKGAVDLAISKPISRPLLLFYKYLGGLTFTFLLTVFTVGGAYAAIGIRTGMWNHNFLAAIPILTFYFAVLYAVSTLAAVFTRSTIIAILATLLAWGLFWTIGKAYAGVANRELAVQEQKDKPNAPIIPNPDDGPPDPDKMLARIDPESPLWGFVPTWAFVPIKAVHTISPRTYQLDNRLDRMIAEGVLTEFELKKSGYSKPAQENWAEMTLASAAFIALMLLLSSWRFVKRDT
jgi:hypothetical protein